MKILIKNGRVIDPASGRDELGDVAIAAGRIVAHRQGAAPTSTPTARIDATGLRRRARPGRPGRAPARARPRARGHARKRAGRGRRRRRDQPGLPARHRPGARRAGAGRDAQVPRPQAAAAARAVPARRADARPGRRGADRDGRTHRGRLRRLLAGRRAARRHAGAAARAAVRRDLRLHGLAAPAGRRGSARAWPPAARWPRGSACRACRWRPRRSRCTRIFELVRATGARVHLCRLSQRRRRGAGARGQGRGPAGHAPTSASTRCT